LNARGNPSFKFVTERYCCYFFPQKYYKENRAILTQFSSQYEACILLAPFTFSTDTFLNYPFRNDVRPLIPLGAFGQVSPGNFLLNLLTQKDQRKFNNFVFLHEDEDFTFNKTRLRFSFHYDYYQTFIKNLKTLHESVADIAALSSTCRQLRDGFKYFRSQRFQVNRYGWNIARRLRIYSCMFDKCIQDAKYINDYGQEPSNETSGDGVVIALGVKRVCA